MAHQRPQVGNQPAVKNAEVCLCSRCNLSPSLICHQPLLMWSEEEEVDKNVLPKATVNDEIMETDDNPAADSNDPQPPQLERKNGRERSMSVPNSRSSEATDVESVVAKAKRASTYLWTLLHAQNCRLGVDRCSHAGCADAKLVHLHLKTCPAGQDFPCPSRYNGCMQARKLLAHYRRCRTIRSRQSVNKGQHVCLICSMVARQARSMLDSSSKLSPKSSSSSSLSLGAQGPVVAHKKSSASSKCQMIPAFTVKATITTGPLSSDIPEPVTSNGRKVFSSFTLSKDTNRVTELFPHHPGKKAGSVDDWGMPPPAPRNPHHISRSAPASPTDGLTLRGPIQQHKGKSGALSPIPLFRKRSESLGSNLGPSVINNNTRTNNGERAVKFAARPEFLDERPDSLVAVELASSVGTDPNNAATRRVRSASCHVISSPNPSSECGTIYEEIGTSSSCMDE